MNGIHGRKLFNKCFLIGSKIPTVCSYTVVQSVPQVPLQTRGGKNTADLGFPASVLGVGGLRES